MRHPGPQIPSRPFPLESLRAFGKGDVPLINAAAGFLAGVGEILEPLARKVGDLLGSPVSLTVLPLPDSFRIDLPAAPAQGPCVAAKIAVAGGGGGTILLVPAATLSRLLSRLVPDGRLEMPADPSLMEALASMLILEALAALPMGCSAARLEAASFTRDFSGLPLRGSFCQFNIRASLERGSDILTLLVGIEDLPGMAEGLGPAREARRGRDAAAGLEVPVRMVAGAARVPAGQLGKLEAGDVLVPDFLEDGASESGPSWVKLVVRRKGGVFAVAACRLDGERLRVEKTFLHHGVNIMAQNDDIHDSDKTELTGTEPRLPEGVSDLPVDVAVEVGRLQMSVGEIASLAQGSIIKLDRPISAEVTLTSGGRILACGMLVSVEGEMGVQIMKVSS